MEDEHRRGPSRPGNTQLIQATGLAFVLGVSVAACASLNSTPAGGMDTLDSKAVDDVVRDAPGDGGQVNLSAGAEVMDAEPEDACVHLALNLDAAPGAKAFTPAGVACITAADCTIYACVGCACFNPVFGVNEASTGECIPPPCEIGIGIGQGCVATGFETQDCKTVPNLASVGLACVNHQCLTVASP